MRKKILFLIIVMFTFTISVSATNVCDYKTISRLRSLVSNVNISYDYYFKDESLPYFSVTLNNIIPGMYFVDSNTGITYNYSNTKNGEITINDYSGNSGNYRFYSTQCDGVSLGSKYYTFPKYNAYYNSSLCEGLSGYSLCQKWADVNYSYYEFEQTINEYKDSLNKDDDDKGDAITYEKSILSYIIDFYVKYCYIVLTSIIVICGTIIIVNKRKNKFKL